MCNVADLNVPLLVELGYGKNWDEALTGSRWQTGSKTAWVFA
ncbi:MAG TPA: hypothetical protein VF296_07120 [Gallionella sp.]